MASIGTRTRPPAENTLTALANFNTNGFVVQTSLDYFVGRTITGSGSVTVSDGNGVAANPVLSINTAWTGQVALAVLGTVTTGTWHGSVIEALYGGTGATSAAGALANISPLTTKGDVLVYGAVNTRLPVGTDGYLLSADSTEATGLKWIIAPSGSLTDGDKGDVTVSASGAVWTIDDGVVTLAKMAGMATASLLGRNTADTGVPEVLSAATAKSLLALNLVENTALLTWAGTTSVVTLGTVTSGTWSATAVGATKGGTAQTTWATGEILYATAADTLGKLAPGSSGYVLTSNGAGVAPTYQAVGTGAGTPPTIVQSKAMGAGGTGITLDSTPTEGNLLVAMWWSPNISADGAGWTQVASHNTGTDWAHIVTKVAGAEESATQSPWSGTAATGGIVMWELTGQDASTPVAASIMGTQTSTLQYIGPALPGVTNCLALHGIGAVNSITSINNATQDQLDNTGTRKVYAGHSIFPVGAQIFGVVGGTSALKCGVALITS